MLGINAKVHRDLDGFVELRAGRTLHELDGGIDLVEFRPLDLVTSSGNALSHPLYSTTCRPMARAEPSIIVTAASTV